MKNKKQILFFACIAFFVAFAAGCEDEPETLGIESYFRVKFINQTSINQLNADIKVIDAEIKQIDDSVKAINALIAGGDQTNYSEIKTSLAERKKVLSTAKTKANATIKLINTGKIHLTKLASENGAKEIIYEDSLSTYKFPLNSHADESDYIITIVDQTYTLNVSYTRETIFKERAVIVKAFNFKIDDYSNFINLKASQPDSTNLSSNEVTATVYF